MTAEDAPTEKPIVLKQEAMARPVESMIVALDEVKRWYKAFDAFKSDIILSNDNFHYQVTRKGVTKDAVNRAGWRAVALGFHLSDQVIEKRIIPDPTDPKHYTVEVTVRIFH